MCQHTLAHTCAQAWQESPFATLQLMAHLRDVRGGKGEGYKFHDCVAWLLEYHPATLAANLRRVPNVRSPACSAVSMHLLNVS